MDWTPSQDPWLKRRNVRAFALIQQTFNQRTKEGIESIRQLIILHHANL